jgi:hypothetical protein
VYVDYIKRLAGVLLARRPVLLFGSGYQSGLRKKSTNDKYLGMLCQGNLVGGVRGHHTKGGEGAWAPLHGGPPPPKSTTEHPGSVILNKLTACSLCSSV